MHPTTSPLSPPRVPGYEILRKLGEGGMGRVFLARQADSERPVAIKLLTAVEGDRHRRFAREAEVASRARHPNLVAVLDHSDDPVQPYLVMEYVEGGDLRALLEPGKPLALARASALLGEVVQALAYLEGQDVVHRDLKPENVLLTPEGSVKLADFGLASRLSQIGLMTTTGEILGTVDYMAPEQRARLPVDGRADQYAAAVIAYEMLTGRRPVGRFKPPSALNRRLSRRADVVLYKALQEDPDDRYPTTREFGDALAKSLEPKPLPAWWFAAAACVFVAALAAWRAVGASAPHQEENLVSTEPRRDEAAAPSPKARFDELMRQAAAHDGRSERALAIKCYTEAVALAPDDPLPLVRRAHARMLLNQYDDAMSDVEKALRLAADHADARVGRAAILLQRNRPADALPDLDRAVEVDPTHALAFAHRGRTHLRLGDRIQARADLDRAVTLDPKCGLAYFYRGTISREQRRTRDAIDDFAKTVECTPDNPFAHRALATLLATASNKDLRDGKRAARHAEMACDITKWNSWKDIQILSQAQAEAGDFDAAAASAEKALALNPPPADAAKLTGSLKRYKEGQP